ncbi:hypothetical protein FQN52_008799 [Onygenales sp. PD_12]|nr:hypothetical protein FQN52_008799 [Onygenales sp. PD_12]
MAKISTAAATPVSPRRYATFTTATTKLSSDINLKSPDNNNKAGKKERKPLFLSLLSKISSSKSSNRSRSPFPSPSPCSSSSTPQQGSTVAPRHSNPLSPTTSTSLVSINLKPAEYLQRIKRLLAQSRKPSSPLSSSNPPSPKAIGKENNNTNNEKKNNDDDIINAHHEPQHQTDEITPQPAAANPTNNTPKPPQPQQQTRSSSPLLPPIFQNGLIGPSKDSKFLKTFLRPSLPKSNTPLTQYNIEALQAELETQGKSRGAIDASKPLAPDDVFDELLELSRSARCLGTEEQDRTREKLVTGVEKWLGAVEEGDDAVDTAQT